MVSKLILVQQDLSPEQIKATCQNVKWVYFGKEYLDRKKWEDVLGLDNKINYKRLLSELSFQIKDQYLTWIIELGKPFFKDEAWWITSFANRNHNVNNLFLKVCYLLVLQALVRTQKDELVVVSDCYAFLTTLNQIYKNKLQVCFGQPYKYRFKKMINDQLLQRWFIVGRTLKYFINSAIEYVAARLTCVFAKEKPEAYADNHTVIHACVDDSCLKPDGTFYDRYFPGLANYLRKRKVNVSTLVWLFNVKKKSIFSVFKWFRQNRESFLIPQDYYNLWDTFKAWLTLQKSAGYKFSRAARCFRGLDLTALLNNEQRQQRANTAMLYFLNLSAIFKRFKRRGIELNRFIVLWEFKYYELLFATLKRFYPQCKTYAFQHSALTPQLLFANYRTTPEEFAAFSHADLGIVNGQTNFRYVLREGFPKDYVKLGPALRFMYLKESHDQAQPKRDKVLVCLPLMESAACEMLEEVYLAFKTAKDYVALWIKPHPMMDLARLRAKLSFSWPNHFKLAQGGMDEWLKQTKVLLVSDSSTMVEAVFKGIPTVVLGKETDIDLPPLDVVEEGGPWSFVKDASALRKQVDEFYFNPSEYSCKMCEDWFSFDMQLLDTILLNEGSK